MIFRELSALTRDGVPGDLGSGPSECCAPGLCASPRPLLESAPPQLWLLPPALCSALLRMCLPSRLPFPSACLCPGLWVCSQHVCLDITTGLGGGGSSTAVPAPLCHGEVAPPAASRPRWVCTASGPAAHGRPPAPGLCLHAHHKLAGHKAQGFLELGSVEDGESLSLSTERFSGWIEGTCL